MTGRTYMKNSWALFLLLYQTIGIAGQGNQCNASLGLADSKIPDSAITSSVNGSTPSAARLNGNGAWCFKLSEIKAGFKVTLTVDLGRTVLVSGVKSQGPPVSLYDSSYSRYIGFKVLNSSLTGGDDWETCCNGNDNNFYARDREGEIDVESTHSLRNLVAARRLRLEFMTGLQWPGDDDKCFRFEIIGCPESVEPITGLSLEAVPSGWVVATWDYPALLIPGEEGKGLEEVTLDATTYLAQMKRSGGGEDDQTTEVEVFARRFTVPSPLWGATYTIELLCGHQGLNLSCGSDSIKAEVSGCNPGESTCLIQDQVVFRRPLWLQAAVVGEEKVELTWSSDSIGWITSSVLLQVTDNDGEEADTQTLTNKDESALINGVTGGNNYSVAFLPQANSESLATFKFHLHILAWEGVRLSTKEIGYGAFVTDVGLSANILWNGTLRVSWTPALVLGVSWEDPNAQLAVSEDSGGIQELTTAASTDVTSNLSTTTATTEEELVVNATTFGNDTFDLGNDTDSAGNDTEVEETNSDLTENELDDFAVNDTVDSSFNSTEDIVSASPTPVENSDATAYMYTIYLSSEGEDRSENITDISDEMISIDLGSLSFEKQYDITLTCHFGDVSVMCGDTSIYTALPLHWTMVKDEIIIHAPAQGLGSWATQEEQCGSSSGTLVTLANAIEDLNLLNSLTKGSIRPTLDTFWIGLNMCPDYPGTLWSDGSSWDHNRLPSVDSMLSSATCCIKAVWSPAQRHFTWLGEACDALLPAICEFHPEGMVGETQSVERGSANITEASVSWSYNSNYWTASDMMVEYCPARALVNISLESSDDGNLGNCTSTIVDADTAEFIQTDLIPFTEYNVTVSARIGVLEFNGKPTQTVIRTYPETPIIVRTLPSGQLHIMWAQKVADFEEKDNVVLRVTSSTNPGAPIASRTIEAIGYTINDISLGATYSVTLKELGNKRREETMTVQAFPTCPCGDECQIEGTCHVVQDKQTDGFSASRRCIDENTKLISVENSAQVDLLLQMAEELRDDLWVDPDSKKIAATDPNARDTAALLTEDAEILDDEAVTEDRASRVCLMVSRRLKAVVVEACSIMHRPACSHKAPISPAFPPVSDINADIGGNWITLDWTWEWGWKATYTIYYQRTLEKRYKRALRDQQFQKPPVAISGLQLDTSYTIELVADMGGGFLSSSDEFTLVTSNDTSKAVTNKLTVSSAPIGRFHIMQLVCSSLLVAACITTMLLFFATGMFYQDCVAQLAFQGTLMAAFLNLMLAHPNPVKPENESGCIVVGVVLHFLFLCAFMFLMLESLTYAHLLVIQVRSPFQKSNWLLMAFGLSVPLVIVGVSAGFTYSEYPDFPKSNCWLNGSGGAVWGEAIPIFVFVVASVLLLICTICNKETPPELIEINLRSRQGDSHKLRWVLMALILELTIVWSTGVSAYHTQDPPTRTTFCVFTLILAITIAGARTSLDDTFRSKMHRLCCGTELTYKRSEIVSLSGKSRVAPSPNNLPSASSTAASASPSRRSYSTEESKTSAVMPSMQEEFSLPNTPPQKEDQNVVLVRRSYRFDNDGPSEFMNEKDMKRSLFPGMS